MPGVQTRKSGRRQSSVKVVARARRTLAEIAKVQKELEKIISGSRGNLLARVRRIQNDSKRLQVLRAQYTQAVSERTLELNESFPLPVE